MIFWGAMMPDDKKEKFKKVYFRYTQAVAGSEYYGMWHSDRPFRSFTENEIMRFRQVLDQSNQTMVATIKTTLPPDPLLWERDIRRSEEKQAEMDKILAPMRIPVVSLRKSQYQTAYLSFNDIQKIKKILDRANQKPSIPLIVDFAKDREYQKLLYTVREYFIEITSILSGANTLEEISDYLPEEDKSLQNRYKKIGAIFNGRTLDSAHWPRVKADAIKYLISGDEDDLARYIQSCSEVYVYKQIDSPGTYSDFCVIVNQNPDFAARFSKLHNIMKVEGDAYWGNPEIRKAVVNYLSKGDTASLNGVFHACILHDVDNTDSFYAFSERWCQLLPDLHWPIQSIKDEIGDGDERYWQALDVKNEIKKYLKQKPIWTVFGLSQEVKDGLGLKDEPIYGAVEYTSTSDRYSEVCQIPYLKPYIEPTKEIEKRTAIVNYVEGKTSKEEFTNWHKQICEQLREDAQIKLDEFFRSNDNNADDMSKIKREIEERIPRRVGIDDASIRVEIVMELLTQLQLMKEGYKANKLDIFSERICKDMAKYLVNPKQTTEEFLKQCLDLSNFYGADTSHSSYPRFQAFVSFIKKLLYTIGIEKNPGGAALVMKDTIIEIRRRKEVQNEANKPLEQGKVECKPYD
jgi:hypothetical protein